MGKKLLEDAVQLNLLSIYHTFLEWSLKAYFFILQGRNYKLSISLIPYLCIAKLEGDPLTY